MVSGFGKARYRMSISIVKYRSMCERGTVASVHLETGWAEIPNLVAMIAPGFPPSSLGFERFHLYSR